MVMSSAASGSWVDHPFETIPYLSETYVQLNSLRSQRENSFLTFHKGFKKPNDYARASNFFESIQYADLWMGMNDSPARRN